MLRLTRIADRPATAEEAARAVRLRLAVDERAKSRLAAMSVDGRAVAILLPRGSVLREGTVLLGEDGTVAVVEAARQPVARVTAASPLALMRAVYHLANRHVPAQLAADHALIERDPVLEAMLRSLGARVEHIEAPFDPESGAYHEHHGHAAHEPIDDASASLGEQLSIEAHARRTR